MKIYILTIITALLINSVGFARPPCNDTSASRAQQGAIKKNDDENSILGCSNYIGPNPGGSSGSGGWGGTNQNNYIGRYHVRTTAPGTQYTYLRIAMGTTLQQCQSDLGTQMSQDTTSTVFEIFGIIEYCHAN